MAKGQERKQFGSKDKNDAVRMPSSNDNVIGTNIVEAFNSYGEAFSSAMTSSLFGNANKDYNTLISFSGSNKISILTCLDSLRKDSTYISNKVKKGNIKVQMDSTGSYDIFYKKLDDITSILYSLVPNKPISETIPVQENIITEEVNNTISYKEDLNSILQELQSKFDSEDKQNISNFSTNISDIKDYISSFINDYNIDKSNSQRDAILSNIFDSLSDIESNSNKLEFIFNTKDAKNFDKIIEQIGNISSDGIKNIERLGTMLAKLNALNFTNVSDFIFALNLFTELKVRKVNRVFNQINKDLIDNVNISIDKLREIKAIPASVMKSIASLQDVYLYLTSFTDIKDLIKARIAFKLLKNLLGDEKSAESLTTVISEINKFPKLTTNTKNSLESIEKIFNTISIIGNTSFTKAKKNISHVKGTIEALIKEIQKIKVGDFDAEATIEPVTKVLDLIEDKIFNRLNSLANEVDSADANIYKISSVIEKTKYMALSTRDIDEQDLKDSEEKTNNLITSVYRMGILMTIGGLLMSYKPEIIMSSLRFGVVFGTFLLELSVPIAVLGLIAVYIQKGEDQHWLDITGDFIVKAGFLLALASLIFLIPKLDLAAIGFAKIFAQFLIALTIPVAIMSFLTKQNVLEDLDAVSMYLTRAMFVLTLGSMIMLYRNGIIYKNALKFGLTLALFIGETLLPFVVYSWLVKNSLAEIESFTQFIVVSAAVMTLGALVAGNQRLMKNALKFGLYLSGFILLTVAPFILFRKFEQDLGDTINAIRKVIISSALVMMIGALFVQNRRLVEGAKTFTKLMFWFILGTVSPFLLFGSVAVKLFATVKTLLVFVVTCSALLMIGAFVFMKVPGMAIAAVAFTVLLHFFIKGVLSPFKKLSFKEVAGATIVATAISTLLISISVALAINTLIYHVFKNEAFVGLALTLAVVGVMIGIVYALNGKKLSGDIKKATINTLILCGLLLAIGATIFLITKLIPDPKKTLQQLILAIGTLGILIGLSWVLSKIDQKLVLKSIMTVVALTVMVLAIGVSLYLIAKSGASWKQFGILAIMSAIVIGEVALIYLISKIKTVEIMNAIKVIAAISVAMIAIGISLYLITKSGADWKQFGILAIMSIIILGEAWLMTKLVESVKLNDILGAIAIIGAISLSMILMSYALKILASSEADWKHVLMLTVMSAAVVVFSLLIKALGKISLKDAAVGLAVIGVSTLIVLGLSHAIKAVAESGAEWKHVGMIFALEGAVAAMAALMIGIGAIAAIPGLDLIMVAGVAIVASITAIIMGLSDALVGVANAASVLEKIEHPERITATLNATIKSFSKIDLKDAKKIVKDAKALRKVLKVLVPPLSNAAVLIRDMSSMKVPTGYDEKGRALGYTQLGPEHFEKAGQGISIILTTIALAIQQTSAELDKISSRKSFKRALKFSEEVGYIISSIASGLKSYSLLKFPIYGTDGKIIGYENLQDKDFKKIAENISTVIVSLAWPIAQIASGKGDKIKVGDNYISAKDFNDAVIGKNKNFNKVLDYSSQLGKVISSIANGVANFAKGKIPRYGEDGKITGYDSLKDLINDTSLVSNISTVITGLFNAMATVARDNEDLFNVDLFSIGFKDGKLSLKTGGTQSPIQKAINFSLSLSQMLKNLAEGLQQMSELKFAEYNPDGSVSKYVTVLKNDDSTFNKIAENISNVITTMAKGVIAGYNSLEEKKIKDVEKKISSLAPLGNLIKEMAEGLSMYAKLIIPQYDKDGKIINNMQLKPDDFVRAGVYIKTILTTIANGVLSVFQDENGDTIVKPDKMKLMIESISGVGGLIKTVANAIQLIADGGIPEYGPDGKIIGRTPFEISDIQHYKDIIKEIMLSGFNVITEIKNEFPSYFGKKAEDLDKILETILKPTELIKKSAELIKFISEYTIPEYKDGKVVNKIHLTDEKINSIVPIVETLISSVPNSIIHGYNSIENKNIEDYIAISDIIDTVSLLISQINTNIIQKLTSNFSFSEELFKGTRLSSQPDNEDASITGMPPVFIDLYYVTSGIYRLYSLISEISNKKINKRNLNRILDIFPDIEGFIISIANYDLSNLVSSLNSISNEVLESLTSDEGAKKIEKLIMFYSNLFRSVSVISNREILLPKEFLANLNTLSTITSTILACTNELLGFGIDNTYITNIIDKLNNINILFENVDNYSNKILSILDGKINYSQKLDELSTFKNYILSIFGIFNELSTSIDNIDATLFESKVIPLVNSIGETLTSLRKVFLEKEDNQKKSYAISIGNMLGNKGEMKTLQEKVIDFSDSMVILTKMSLIAAGASSDGFDIIAKGYEEINENISKFTNENNAKFTNHTEVLERYVKAVNSLDENKLYKLNDLLETMNRLATNLGNIDKFTEVLADKLAETLNELSSNISTAEETINKAEKMQKERQKAIKDSIDEVKELMKIPLRVGVKNLKDGETVESTWENPKHDKL